MNNLKVHTIIDVKNTDDGCLLLKADGEGGMRMVYLYGKEAEKTKENFKGKNREKASINAREFAETHKDHFERSQWAINRSNVYSGAGYTKIPQPSI